MIRDVNLIKHLPPFLQKYLEMRLITDTENPEFQLAMDESERIKDNTFILTADEEGLARFENILNIYVAKDEDLESRRSRVMSRWNDISPYTYNALVSKLQSLHNSDNFIINRKYEDYEIEIITHLELVGQVDELDRILDYIMPVHLVVDSKNRIYCHAEGGAYTAGGMAYATMFDLTDQYNVDFDIDGMHEVGAGHSITHVIEADESYHEDFDIQGRHEVGTSVSNAVTIEVDDSYHADVNINGDSETGMNIGNVQVITTEG